MDFAPGETQIALQGMARNFAHQEILPALEAPGWEPGFPADLLEKGSRLGLRTLALPEELGGGGADLLTLCFVGEELGWADLGVGATFAQDWSVTHALKHICGEDRLKEFAAEFAGDHLVHLTRAEISADLRPEDRPPYETGFREIPALAERAGEEWLVSGLAPRVMNGEDARRILLSVESSEDASRHAFFIDTEEGKKPDIARRFDSMGMRTCRDVSLSFENFPISERRRIPCDAEAWARATPALLALPCSAALGTAR
ncbi:MAG: acyl-CoA dehydrogenase family protein, partial [bacterium]